MQNDDVDTTPGIGNRPVGRPTIYTEELGMEIAERIMFGESLRKICADENMPSKATLCRWLTQPSKYSEFYKQYRTAREVQADFMMDEILSIADDVSKDVIANDKGYKYAMANIQRAKLQIDARKWAISHMLPKKTDTHLIEEIERLKKRPREFIIQKNYMGMPPEKNTTEIIFTDPVITNEPQGRYSG